SRSGTEEFMVRSFRRGASAASLDLGDISRVIGDIERGLGQLAAVVSANARHATETVPDRMSDALSDISDRLHALRFNARTAGRHHCLAPDRGRGRRAARAGAGGCGRHRVPDRGAQQARLKPDAGDSKAKMRGGAGRLRPFMRLYLAFLPITRRGAWLSARRI